jgi:uncharacterized repeat protein (TIGR03843 family)
VPEDERERSADHVSDDEVSEHVVSKYGSGDGAPEPIAPEPGAAEPSAAEPSAGELGAAEWLQVLSTGEVEIEGRLPWSSNFSFLVSVRCGMHYVRAVYKPGRGERELWDFGDRIFRREVAAYELSAWVGLALVPETVLRADAPLGEGSLQRFVDADFEQHYFTLVSEPACDARLRELAGFDMLLNNADRKSGHVLVDASGSIWGIDNGLCFHAQPKLRTVMWDFAGERVPDAVVDAAARVREEVPASVCSLISETEAVALADRARALVRRPKFPSPGADHRAYPWPLV